MKTAIIADVHANLAALETALAAIDDLGIDRIVCLGDVVGYNASPGDCIDRIREREILTLSGNHDRYVATGDVEGIKPESRQVIDWTREQLSPEQLKWLSKLPDQHTLDSDYLLVHGSPVDRDEYLLKPPQWQRSLKEMKTKYFGLHLCFFGHTHYPMVIAKGFQEVKLKESKTVPLDRKKLYLINPGSVGQPRDGVPLASFCVFDDEEYQLDYHRLEYDVADTQSRVREAGFARKFADRLAIGR